MTRFLLWSAGIRDAIDGTDLVIADIERAIWLNGQPNRAAQHLILAGEEAGEKSWGGPATVPCAFRGMKITL